MFKMIEVVGVSSQSMSAAIKKAVETIQKSEGKVAWFEVVEQRGAMHNNQIQFQAKIKAGVSVSACTSSSCCSMESKSAEEKICPTCNEPVNAGGHMCSPKALDGETCDWCGVQIADERHLCGDKAKELSYICNSCGRTAVKAENLCDPKKI
ncbi:MAG: dodecin family protein [Candidatus Auribacterota bacterium]